MKPMRTLAILVTVTALAACAETTTAPETTDAAITDDVAQMAADAAILDLAALDESSELAGRRGPGGRPLHGPFPGGATFYDADGEVMDRYDRLLTASVSWSFSREVELERGNVSGSVARTRSLTISGLEGEETVRIHDGEGTDERSRVAIDAADGTRSYDFESRVVIEAVVHAVDRDTQPWPRSGTITREMEIAVVNGPNGDVTRSRTSVLTFDGTQYATLVVDGEIFEVDLAKRGGRAAERSGPRGRGGGGGPTG